MEHQNALNNSKMSNSNLETGSKGFLLSDETEGKNPILENILSEGGDDLFQYLSWIGLSKDPNLMVLSSSHHYYYDHNDLIGIKTLINMKRLNQVKHLESFLNILYRILPPKAYFVGCFRNCSPGSNFSMNNGSYKLSTGLINIFSYNSERNLTKRSVTKLLEEHHFKVVDITDINGLTYFWSQSLRKQTE